MTDDTPHVPADDRTQTTTPTATFAERPTDVSGRVDVSPRSRDTTSRVGVPEDPDEAVVTVEVTNARGERLVLESSRGRSLPATRVGADEDWADAGHRLVQQLTAAESASQNRSPAESAVDSPSARDVEYRNSGHHEPRFRDRLGGLVRPETVRQAQTVLVCLSLIALALLALDGLAALWAAFAVGVGLAALVPVAVVKSVAAVVSP